MKKLKALSLAESLITLSMLGTIAVLAISSLKVGGYKQDLYDTAYEKLYAEILNVTGIVLVMDRRSTIPFSQAEGAVSIRNAYAEHLDIVSVNSDDASHPYMILNNGTKITFVVGNTDGYIKQSYADFVGSMIIDFNGSKEPNKENVDIRYIPLCANGICRILK